jgi:hypothetical protein
MERNSLGADPITNTVPLLKRMTWYHVSHCKGNVRLLTNRGATPLGAAIPLLRDVTADADVMCSSTARKRGRGDVTW